MVRTTGLAVLAITCAVAQANQCLRGGECPSDDQPKSVVSLFQTNLLMNVLKVGGEEKGAEKRKETEDKAAVNKPIDDQTESITADGNEKVFIRVDNAVNAISSSDDDPDVTSKITTDTKEVKVNYKVVKVGKDLAEVHKRVTVIKIVTSPKNTETEKDTKEVMVKHKVVKTDDGPVVVNKTTEETDDNKTVDESGSTSGDDDTANRRAKGGATDADEPFASQNKTVDKHTLNITRRKNSTHNETQQVTIREIIETTQVAGPYRIASIYMVLFVPVLVLWAFYYHHGQQTHHYTLLLPLTMCCLNTGFDMVNQSLAMILEAPHAITAIQAFAMGIAACVWSLCANWSDLSVEVYHHVSKVAYWLPVAVLFSIFQIVNHIVYAKCSLSERTVIISLCPLVLLTLERLLFSEAMKPMVTFNGKIALALMVVGAVLFSMQSPSFTLFGIGVATLLLLTTVPYRLASRKFLAEGLAVPISVLVCIDGFMVCTIALSFSVATNDSLWTHLSMFLEPSICFMLVLSIVTFIGSHVCALAMLRLGSATTFQVFQTMASFATIILSIIFFGDRALGTPLASVGLITNVASGVWYAVDGKPDAESCVETKSHQQEAENHDEPQTAIAK